MASVRIEWYGHSYFLIGNDEGTVIIDPHDGGSLNLPTYRLRADTVLITHNHYDHNAVEVVEANKIIRWRKGSFTIPGFEVTGIESYHDKSQGRLRGSNTVYILRSGDITIGHLGDIGHLLNEDLAHALKEVDILMIPVGGVYTIDAYEAWEIVRLLRPPLVVPMHFWMPNMTVPLDPLDRFLNIAKTRRLRVEGNVLEVEKEDLPDKTTTVVFQLPR